MSAVWRVKSGPAARPRREHAVAKFRDRLPALGEASAQVRMARQVGELGEQQWLLEAGGRAYVGARERIGVGGGSGSANSSYVLFRVDPSTRTLQVMPLDEWYDFRPRVEHATFTTEEAERALERNDHGGSRLERKLLQRG